MTFKNINAALTTRHAHAPMTNSVALLGVAVLFSTSKWLLYLALSTKRNRMPRHSIPTTISSTVRRIGVCFAVCI